MARRQMTHGGREVEVGDRVVGGPEAIPDDGLSATHRTDPAPALVAQPARRRPTARELRDKGYSVPDTVADDDVPTAFADATPRTDAAPALVESYVPARDWRTPAERARDAGTDDTSADGDGADEMAPEDTGAGGGGDMDAEDAAANERVLRDEGAE